jgi:hypothetical protein
MLSKDDIRTIRKDINGAFSGLHFDEKSHTYQVDGKFLISSTTFVKEFTEPFDSSYMSRVMCKLYNDHPKRVYTKKRSTRYYRKRWRNFADAATNRGTRVHDYVEWNYPDFIDEPACEQEMGVVEFFSHLPSHYSPIAIEIRMFNKKYSKAGTADFLLVNRKTGKLVILDWKTGNKNVLQYYNNKKLKAPFKDRYATGLNKYTIQLCDYQNMIEMATHYEVEERWIVHLLQNDWTKLDFGKRNQPDKYKIDNVTPYKVGEYYRWYKLDDISEKLLPEYERILKENNKILENV